MKKTSIGHYALGYLLWIITIAVSLLVCMVILDTSLFAMVAADWHRYPIHAVRQFLIATLGVVALILLVWNEHYFRTGAEKNRLLERFARMVGYFLVVMGLAHAIQFAISLLSGDGLSLTQVGLGIAELAVGFGGIWYARRAVKERKLAIYRTD